MLYHAAFPMSLQSLLDLWPLPGPTRRDGKPLLSSLDARTQDWHNFVLFVARIYPEIKWPGGGCLREFAQYVLPKYGSRNRVWAESIGLPKVLWPQLTHSGMGGSQPLLYNVDSKPARDWVQTYNKAHSDHYVELDDGNITVHYKQDRCVAFYAWYSMGTASRRSMLCRFCTEKPGYLLEYTDPFFECPCSRNVAVHFECHRCLHKECYMCAIEKNKANWTTWPPAWTPP